MLLCESGVDGNILQSITVVEGLSGKLLQYCVIHQQPWSLGTTGAHSLDPMHDMHMLVVLVVCLRACAPCRSPADAAAAARGSSKAGRPHAGHSASTNHVAAAAAACTWPGLGRTGRR
jgi:hypothetical protein